MILRLKNAPTSGVTEQLGALSNFAIQGPPEAADKSTKFAKFPTSKWSSYRQNQGKPKPQRQVKTSVTGVYGSFIYEGTIAQETYWR